MVGKKTIRTILRTEVRPLPGAILPADILFLFLRFHPIGEMYSDQGDCEDETQSGSHSRDDEDDFVICIPR